jgi:hypothetical protein
MSKRKESRALTGATLAILVVLFSVALFSNGVARAQGYAPGVNPSNPQDLTNRSNPQSLTVPGGSNRQDLVRTPTGPRALSPGNPTNFSSAPLRVNPSFSYTHIDGPIDQPADKKKFVRRKRHGTDPAND